MHSADRQCIHLLARQEIFASKEVGYHSQSAIFRDLCVPPSQPCQTDKGTARCKAVNASQECAQRKDILDVCLELHPSRTPRFLQRWDGTYDREEARYGRTAPQLCRLPMEDKRSLVHQLRCKGVATRGTPWAAHVAGTEDSDDCASRQVGGVEKVSGSVAQECLTDRVCRLYQLIIYNHYYYQPGFWGFGDVLYRLWLDMSWFVPTSA